MNNTLPSEPKQERPSDRAREDLVRAVDMLGEAIATLKARIQPILRPESPAAEEKTPIDSQPNGSPITNLLREMTGRINSMGNSVEETTERID